VNCGTYLSVGSCSNVVSKHESAGEPPSGSPLRRRAPDFLPSVLHAILPPKKQSNGKNLEAGQIRHLNLASLHPSWFYGSVIIITIY
jgi:hypothetical protein